MAQCEAGIEQAAREQQPDRDYEHQEQQPTGRREKKRGRKKGS